MQKRRLTSCSTINMIRLRSFLLLFLFSTIAISCGKFKFPSTLFETSERAKYERQFSGNDSLMKIWKSDFDSAVQNQLKIEDGYSVTVPAKNSTEKALGYSVELKKGDLLIIETIPSYSESKIFIDVFEDSSSSEPSKSALIINGIWSTLIENDTTHKVVIQPEIGHLQSFALKIYTQPSLIFPVVGKGNRDVQSFWGASRDGGGRSHEGLDIFAKRGTPVIAASAGYITRTGNQGLGGKQVWLRASSIGASLYYAHLDSVITQSGKQIKIGDTLGLVGNTGNAKGGATHLHFGIYSIGGAVDAFPFVRERKIPASRKMDLKLFKYLKAGSNIRHGPSTKHDIVSTESEEIPLKILAIDGEWYHIKTKKRTEGFVNISRLK